MSSTIPFPLSLEQERLWFIEQVFPGQDAYHISVALGTSNDVDLDYCCIVLNELCARHDALRTAIGGTVAFPTQKVFPIEECQIRVDSEVLYISDGECVQNRCAEIASKPFDLSVPPLLRVYALRIEKGGVVLVFSIHHIIADGWSLKILLREFGALYAERAGGRSLPLPLIEHQFREHVEWQRSVEAAAFFERQIEAWRFRYSNIGVGRSLAADLTHEEGAHGSNKRCFSFRSDFVRKTRSLCNEMSATPFNIYTSIVGIFLAKWNDIHRVCIGFPVLGRRGVKFERTIGCFANTLALPVHSDPQKCLRDIAAETRNTTWELLNCQELPFMRLIERLNVERKRGRNSLFEVFVSYEADSSDVSHFLGIKAEMIPLRKRNAKFDLSIAMRETESGLEVEIEYDSSKFSALKIEGVADLLKGFCERVIDQPSTPVGIISLYGRSQRTMLLKPSDEKSVSATWQKFSGFFRDCIGFPVNVVASWKHFTLTYAELSRLVKIIGESLRRDFDSGTLFVLNLHNPLNRLCCFVACLEVELPFVLPERYGKFRTSNLLEWPEDLVTVISDFGADLINGPQAVNFSRLIGVDEFVGKTEDASYSVRLVEPIIASQCRLVQYPADSMLDFLAWGCNVFTERDLQSSFVLDDGARFGWADVLLTLRYGGTMRFVSHDERRLAVLPDSSTFMMTTSALASQALGQVRLDGRLRVLCVVGELYDPRVSETFFESGGRSVFEFFVTSSLRFCGYHEREHKSSPFEGYKAITNRMLCTLDSEANLTAPGTIGEIYVDADLAAKVVSIQDGGSMEATGHFGFRTENGRVVALDKREHSLQIGGEVFTLGGIERELFRAGIPAVVSWIEKKSAQPKLSVAVHGKVDDWQRRTRTLLTSILPDTVQSVVWTLDKIPMDDYGEIDREVISSYGKIVIGNETNVSSRTIPTSRTEKRLVAIWGELLEQTDFDISESFFDVGGNSILAIRLIAGVNKEFGATIDVSSLFDAPSIAELARLIDEKPTKKNRDRDVVMLRKSSSARKRLFLLHPSGGTVSCYGELAQRIDKDFDVFGLEARGLSGDAEGDIRTMAEGYLREIRSIQPRGPYYVAGWSMGGVIAFEIACQLKASKEDLAALVMIEPEWSESAHLNFDEKGFDATNIRRRLQFIFGEEIQLTSKNVPKDDRRAFVDELLDVLQRQRLLPSVDPDKYLDRLISVVEMNQRALTLYRPPRILQDVTIIEALDKSAGPSSINSYEKIWGKFISGKIRVVALDGNHYSIMRAPNVNELAAVLNSCIQ